MLSNVNLKLTSGSVYGLSGKNGSGKTMLLRALAGLILPTCGFVMIDKKKLGKDIQFPPSVGVLIETPVFIGKYSGLKNLELLASINNEVDREEISQTLTDVGLDPCNKKPFSKYSLGMRQRLGLACAMMGKPDLVLLDEPFNAMDAEGVQLAQKIILKSKLNGALVLLACHDLQQLGNLCDGIYTLADGRVLV